MVGGWWLVVGGRRCGGRGAPDAEQAPITAPSLFLLLNPNVLSHVQSHVQKQYAHVQNDVQNHVQSHVLSHVLSHVQSHVQKQHVQIVQSHVQKQHVQIVQGQIAQSHVQSMCELLRSHVQSMFRACSESCSESCSEHVQNTVHMCMSILFILFASFRRPQVLHGERQPQDTLAMNIKALARMQQQ